MYDVLKQELSNFSHYFSAQDIDELVKEYDSVIASKRRSSFIKNIDDLVSVLEKRCFITPEDHSELHRIVIRLPHDCRERMLTLMNNQEKEERDTQNNDLNAHCLLAPRVESSLFGNTRRQGLPKCVVERVSEEIGNKWRDLARGLDLRQGDINIIERKHAGDFQKCANEALLLYEKKYHKDDLQANLLKALEKARRRDLREIVQHLMTHTNR